MKKGRIISTGTIGSLKPIPAYSLIYRTFGPRGI